MKFTRALLLILALCLPATATPGLARAESSGIGQLTERLRSSDFRVRVQAALLLGKSGDARALSALVRSLEDESVAVRAAAAAALSTMGDPAALPALRRQQDDSSSAVKRRIAASIQVLEARQRAQIAERQSAKILVKFEMFGSPATDSPEALGAAVLASRRVLEQMAGVAVLNPTEDPQVAARRHDRPVLVMRASLRKLSASNEGSNVVVSVNVEFLVERYPEQSIVGRLSGNASAMSQADSKRERMELQEEAVDAAVASALQKSQTALFAAARHG